MFYRNKIIPLGDDTINMIRRDPTHIMGWFEKELMEAWLNIFPLTETSRQLDNGRGMDLDSESVVALRHRSSSPPSHSPEQLQSVREAFNAAPLGTLAVRDGSGSARTRDHREKDFGRKTSGVCNDGEYPQGEAFPVLNSQDQAHDFG